MNQRSDLLHLSPEALTQATNAGLVKRGIRELAAGYRPKLALDAVGLLEAEFSDNVRCRWPAGATIQQAGCSCGAAGVCRHRVIVALAYREFDAATAGGADSTTTATTADAAASPASSGTQAASATAGPQAEAGAAGPASPASSGKLAAAAATSADQPAEAFAANPGAPAESAAAHAAEPADGHPPIPRPRLEPTPTAQATDEALARTIPASLLATARRLADAGISVELRRRASGEPCDTARLPSATVRFWAGAAIEAARCDCLRAAACEHVAIGVWAFRRAAIEAPDAAITSVRLGSGGARHTLVREPFEALAAALLRLGVARGPEVLAQALSAARTAARDAAWLSLLVADIEAWCEAYARRSALYDAAQGVDLLAELALRLAAGMQAGRAESVLGIGVAGETALDRLRLICLGARTIRDGERRRTTLVMADADTGTRLVLPHDWQVPAATASADEAPLRAAERLAPGVKLAALAQGQLLAQQAVRRADGSVRLARARSSQNSVLPQSADWAQLGAPVHFDRVAALAAEQHAHPTAALLPRHAARRFIVFSGLSLRHLGYDPHEQSLLAVLQDADGEELLLQRTHEGHNPLALDAVAGALSGRSGPLRHVAGVIDWDHGHPRIEPWALGCDGVVVPDFIDKASGALAALPLSTLPSEPADPCAQCMVQLRRHLGTLLHQGTSQLPRSWPADSAQLARRLDSAGLRALAEGLRALQKAIAEDDNSAARLLTELAALRQLHEDAAAQAELVLTAEDEQDA